MDVVLSEINFKEAKVVIALEVFPTSYFAIGMFDVDGILRRHRYGTSYPGKGTHFSAALETVKTLVGRNTHLRNNHCAACSLFGTLSNCSPVSGFSASAWSRVV